MYQFFDPTIKPITVTNRCGEIIMVKTKGLEFYGYPNLIMYENIEDYESLFYMLLDSIFSLQFELNKNYMFNGKEVRFTLNEDNDAILSLVEPSEVKIISYQDPVTNEVTKHKSKGLSSLYGLPELEINECVDKGKGIISFVVEELKKGNIIDENSTITIDENEFELYSRQDRFGKIYYEIVQVVKVTPPTHRKQHINKMIKEGLRRIK